MWHCVTSDKTSRKRNIKSYQVWGNETASRRKIIRRHFFEKTNGLIKLIVKLGLIFNKLILNLHVLLCYITVINFVVETLVWQASRREGK